MIRQIAGAASIKATVTVGANAPLTSGSENSITNALGILEVAKTEKEICSLIEAGFEYVTEFEGARIFRKPKL